MCSDTNNISAAREAGYVITFKSPKLSGRARDYGSGYRKIALVKTSDGLAPKMISKRCKTVLAIVSCATCYWGRGIRSEGRAYYNALLVRKADLERA